MTCYKLNLTYFSNLALLHRWAAFKPVGTPSSGVYKLYLPFTSQASPPGSPFTFLWVLSFSVVSSSSDTCLSVFLRACLKPAAFPSWIFMSDLKQAILFWTGSPQQYFWWSCLYSVINVPVMVSFQSKSDCSTWNQSTHSDCPSDQVQMIYGDLIFHTQARLTVSSLTSRSLPSLPHT